MREFFEQKSEKAPEASERGDGRTQKGTNAVRRTALGRGLNALMSVEPVKVGQNGYYEAPSNLSRQRVGLADRTGVAENRSDSALAAAPAATDGLLYLEVSQIERNESQPRQHFSEEELKSLSQSIKESGMLQPILVRALSTDSKHPIYQIVAGERRFRAAREAGLTKVPALLRELSDRETLELAIIENVQRADLNPVEEAAAYRRLIDEFGATQEQVAQTVGKDRTSVANALRLLKLSSKIQEFLVQGKISAGHGRALLVLNSPEEQSALALRIVQEGLSVRAVEQLVSKATADPNKRKVSSKKNEQAGSQLGVAELEERFRRALGTKVALNLSKSGQGELRIMFYSEAELESLIERFGA